MPLATLGALSERLLAHGVEPERPVSAVFNATRPDERVVSGTLATIQALVQATKASGPCLLLMGNALRALRSPGQADVEPTGSLEIRLTAGLERSRS